MNNKSDRPNILFLLNDHQAYYRHGWDGGPKVQRPYFDKLAAEGAEFSRAYTACPLCGPARRTMLTGLYPHNHRELKNDVGHPYDQDVYLDLLYESGYRNYYYGKWHAGPGTAHDHGCEGFNYTSYGNPYTKDEYKAYLREKGLPEPEIWIEQNFNANLQNGEGNFKYKQERNWCNEHASGIMLTPKETHEAFFLAHLASQKLEELAAESNGEPFSMRVDFWGPHQPYFPTQEYADLYPPDQIPVYGSFHDDLSTKPELYRSEKNHRISQDDKLITPNPLPWSEWQQILSRCYGQITMMDEAAGIILETLDRLGLKENTLVIWTTDHGDAVACHGGHFDKRSYMPEEMIRIPLALRYPKHVAPGLKLDKLVNNTDYAPTMLDAAGLSFERPVDGISLLPLCREPDREWRSYSVSETHGHMENVKGRAVVTERYKYVYNEKDLDELYDLAEDPYELINLVFSLDHKHALIEMKKHLAEWRSVTNDRLS